MKKMLRYVAAALAVLTLVGGSALFLSRSAEASSPEGTPDVQIQLSDSHALSPNLPGSCRYDSQWVGTGGGQAILPRSQDTADCIRTRILNHSLQSEYTRDFKICLNLDEATGCTPWASEGGGTALLRSNDGNWFRGSVYVVDRAMPVSGMTITNVRSGVQFYYQRDGRDCRGSSGMQWSSGPQSGMAYGEREDNDPGCARIGLEATQVLPLNAEYVSDTVPNEADASTTYEASITMKNTGPTWISDEIIEPEDNDCENQVPNNGDTCTDQFTIESSNFLLKRTDTTPLVAPATLPYRRVISVQYTRVMGEECEIEPGGDGGNVRNDSEGFFARAWSALVPTAYARPPGGTIICTEYNFVARTESPVRHVFYNHNTDFPVEVGTPGESGTYELKYQMYKVDSNELFGEVAIMPIVVEGGTAGIGLSCTTVSATVNAGQTASFAASVSSLSGFAGQVSVDVVSSTLPAGGSSVAGTVTLPPTPGSTQVLLTTSPSTPSATYPITLRATASGVAPRECETELIVNPGGSAPTLTVAPDMRQIPVDGTASYVATYDPDGPSGPAAAFPVTAPATWSADIPNVGVAIGPGTFRGVATGTTPIWAAYGGLQASSSLVVGVPGGSATLTLVPPGLSMRVSEQGITHAIFDADGSGPIDPVDVSTDTAWSSGAPGIARSDGNGAFTGMSQGATEMYAIYTAQSGITLTASGPIDVTSGASLRVNPLEGSVDVGSTTTYQALYDPDGAGPQTEVDVTASSVWAATTGVAQSLGSGQFLGVRRGITGVQATYSGLDGFASLVVGDGGCASPPCPPTLSVIPPSARIGVEEVAEFDAVYDPDGAGPELGVVVTDATAWSSDNMPVASSLGAGRFRGQSEGTARAVATYSGLTDRGTITVDDGGGNATLRISPDFRQVQVGGQTTFDAYYDPDGTGPEDERPVTGSASWTALTSGVRSEGGGTFTGMSPGDTGVSATYSGESDEADVAVTQPDPGTCSFTANPGTLFIPPLRATTLSWSCTVPTTCTVTKVTGGSSVIATGGQSGSGQHSPAYTTTYNLTCANGVNQNLQVRVFDVTTRIEILPR